MTKQDLLDGAGCYSDRVTYIFTASEIVKAFADYHAIPKSDLETYATYRYALGWARVQEIRATIRRMEDAFDALLEEGKLISGSDGEDRIFEIDGERLIAREVNGKLHIEVYDG